MTDPINPEGAKAWQAGNMLEDEFVKHEGKIPHGFRTRKTCSEMTQELLKQILHYDPETGIFTWVIKPNKQQAANTVAGSLCDGYILIDYAYKHYKAHRLAWLYVYGSWPDGLIDHKDQNKSNNRIDNLRVASKSQNNINREPAKKGKSGVKGVSWVERANKYLARGVINKKHYHLGYHDTIELASAAYQAFAKEHHGEFYVEPAPKP